MNFAKVVGLAWEKTLSVVESSSSSDNESDTDYGRDQASRNVASSKKEDAMSAFNEVPPAVQNVLDKIDMAQLERAKKDVSKKLFRILDNVNRVYERYKRDDGLDPEIERDYNQSQTWEETSRRAHFLDGIDDVLDESLFKIQELQSVQQALKSWYEMLKAVERDEKFLPTNDMVEEIEEKVEDFIIAIGSKIQHLIKLFRPLSEGKTKQRRKSGHRIAMFKLWRDKVAEAPQEGEPVGAERMLDDEPLTFSRTNELNSMLQEMVDSSAFLKAEYPAVKYIAAMVANLGRAFSLLAKQYRSLKIKCETESALESKKPDKHVSALQRELRAVLEKKTAMEIQVHTVEEMCKSLMITNEALQKELQEANEKAMLAVRPPVRPVPSRHPEKLTPVGSMKDMKETKDEKEIKQEQEIKDEKEIKVEKEIKDERYMKIRAELTGGIQTVKAEVKGTYEERPVTKPRIELEGMRSVKIEEGGTFEEPPRQQKPTAETIKPDHPEETPSAADVPMTFLSPKVRDSRSRLAPKDSSLLTVDAQVSSDLSQVSSEISQISSDETGDAEAGRKETATAAPSKLAGRKRGTRTVAWKKLQTSLLKTPSPQKLPGKSPQEPEGGQPPQPPAESPPPKPILKRVTVDSGSEVELEKPPREPSERASPEEPEEGPSPKEPEEGPSPKESEEGPSPKEPEEGPSPKEPEEGLSPKEPAEGPSPKEPEEGPSPKQPEEGPSPKELEEGPSPKEPEEGPSPKEPKEGPSPKQSAEGPSPKEPAEGPSPKQSEEGPSPKQPEEVPSPKQPAEGPSPKQPAEGPKVKRKLSMKKTAGQLVKTIKEKKAVKFGDNEPTQEPARAPGVQKEAGAEVPVESSSPQAGEAKESTFETADGPNGKKQPSGSTPADMPQPKWAEKTGEIIRGLGQKLQELASDRGGMLDVEAIKCVFEEMVATYRDTMQEGKPESRGDVPREVPESPVSGPAEEAGGSRVDQEDTLFTVEIPTLPSALVQKRQRYSIVEEAPGGVTSSPQQEFQEVILACLDEKLETLKKSLSGSWKPSVKSQATHTLTQEISEAIDRKLEECILMKQKVSALQKKQKFPKRIEATEGDLEEEDAKGFKIPSFSFSSPGASQESLSSSFSSGIEWEQEITTGQPSAPKSQQDLTEKKEEEGEEQKGEEQKGEERDQKEPQSQVEEEDLAKVSQPVEEERPPEPQPSSEAEVQAKESWQERGKEVAIQTSAEKLQSVQIRRGSWQKESKPDLESSQELSREKQEWYSQIQEQLQEEKQRLQEEQARLQEERHRLQEEREYQLHWQEMFEGQRQQWEQEKEQRMEQERMWQVQVEHWQLLQQQHKEQEEFWARRWEEQKAQQDLLQKELEQLQVEKRELLALRGKEAKEQWHWRQLKEQHEKQQLLWQEEQQEQERNRSQWQEQLELHEQQMAALRQEQQEQEQRNMQWVQEQKEKHEEMERLWEKRWEQQLLRWRHQMKMQRLQVQRVKAKQQQIQKEEKPLLPKLKVVEGSIVDPLSKQYKIPSAPKERHAFPSPPLSPLPSSSFDEDLLELERTWFPRLFTKAEEFPAPGTTEKRYWINVEAQRRNLEVLGEAVRSAGISSELYTLTKGIIKQALHSNVERLALLFRKYIAFSHLQHVRESLLIRLELAKEAKDGVRMQILYKMVDKLDAHLKKVMVQWTVKQMFAEKQRRRCLERMIALFAQLRLSTKLQLTNPCPLLIKAGDRTKKQTLHVPHIGPVFLKPRTCPSPLVRVKKQQDLTFSAAIREPSGEQIESLWKTDITEFSIPLGPKEPVSLMWSEACGFPDIPRLLELDISSIRKKPLRNIKTRIQTIPRWKLSGYNFMHL